MGVVIGHLLVCQKGGFSVIYLRAPSGEETAWHGMLSAHPVMTVTQSGLGLWSQDRVSNCPGHSIGCQKACPRPSCILWKSLPNSSMTLHCVHYLNHAQRVCFCHHPALSFSGLSCQLHQEPGKSRIGLSISNLTARLPVRRRLKDAASMDSASLFSCFVPAYLSLELHYVGNPLSILRVCHLPYVSCLADEACNHCVYVDHYMFTDSPCSCCSFPDWATPVKLCSIVICMLINGHLHHFCLRCRGAFEFRNGMTLASKFAPSLCHQKNTLVTQ